MKNGNLKRNIGRIAGAATIVAGIALITVPSPTGAVTATVADSAPAPRLATPGATPVEQLMGTQTIQYLNQERAAVGSPPLQENEYLDAMAQAYVNYETNLNNPPAGGDGNNRWDDPSAQWESQYISTHPCTETYPTCPTAALVNGTTPGGPPTYQGATTSTQFGGDLYTAGDIVLGYMSSIPHQENELTAAWTLAGSGTACVSGTQMNVMAFSYDSINKFPTEPEREPPHARNPHI